jgi:transcriptional regulator with XRE-family HTH domain
MHDEKVSALIKSMTSTIKERREDMGMSRVAVEAIAGIESNYLGQIEQGVRNPSLSTLIRIADAVELDVILVEREGKEVPEWLKSQIRKKRK